MIKRIARNDYDAECAALSEMTAADATVVVVVGGDRGDGFSLQITEGVDRLVLLPMLASVMAEVAEEMERLS